MNGSPSPLGGTGSELHAATACRIKQCANAQKVAPTTCTQERLTALYRFASSLLTSSLYKTTATAIVNSNAATLCNNSMPVAGSIALTFHLVSLNAVADDPLNASDGRW